MIMDDEQHGAGAWRLDGMTRKECLAILARSVNLKATPKTALTREKPGGPWWLEDCVTLEMENPKAASYCFNVGRSAHTELQALKYIIGFYADEFDRARTVLKRETTRREST